MLPGFSLDTIANALIRNFENLRKIVIGMLSFRVNLSKFYYFLIGEFRKGSMFSKRMSSLFKSIFYILGFSSKPKMIGVNARWVITRMAYTHTFWDRSLMDLVRKPMRPFLSISEPDSTIAGIRIPSPFPTIGPFLNITPEIIYNSFVAVLHSNDNSIFGQSCL